jgi:hypothetical protein
VAQAELAADLHAMTPLPGREGWPYDHGKVAMVITDGGWSALQEVAERKALRVSVIWIWALGTVPDFLGRISDLTTY